MKKREVAIFLLVALAVCALVFNRGLWGQTLMAPVDIAPALLSHYQFVDPSSNGIPANHHVVDQLGYDLPLQWTIYHAYRRGEIPWWDPYTFCGRPLLADAHISGTDPLRILIYLLIPSFELAYNWTRIAHFLVGSLGLFYLLRRFNFTPALAGSLALAGGFAGCHAIYFGHPWIQASLVYYPWLWSIWHAAWQSPRGLRNPMAALLVSAIFLAGNLQSHAYLALFGAIWTVAYSGYTWPGMRHALWITGTSGLLGALIAAPVLIPQVELFFLNDRLLIANAPAARPVDGVLSLAALFPWSLGTFRTVTYQNLSFLLFTGCAAVALGFVGAFSKPQADKENSSVAAWRCAFWLTIAFLVILTIPPVARMLYMRSAGLGVLGLTVLAAFGTQAWLQAASSNRYWRAFFVFAAIATVIGTFASTRIVYPAVKQKLEQTMTAHSATDLYGGLSINLRKFQVENFPAEVSFSNVEVSLGWLSLAAIAALSFTAVGKVRTSMLGVAVILSLASLLLFVQRSVPHTPLKHWKQLLTGGPEQQRAIERLRSDHRRLLDNAPAAFFRLIPQNFAHFYQVHTVHGYAALQPLSQAWTATVESNPADWVYTTREPRRPGELNPLTFPEMSRFLWQTSPNRQVRVVSETLNRLEVHFPSGKGDLLVRTDTFYPGWIAKTLDGRTLGMERWRETSSAIHVPDGATGIIYEYHPRGISVALVCCVIGMVSMLLLPKREYCPGYSASCRTDEIP